jgi:hypothetical protein
MTNLQIEICLKDYPATMCYANELPAHVGARPRTFIVNTDSCNRGWRFIFPKWEMHRKRITAVSPTF